jgi:cyclic pyranopterin phosphate synthase
MTSATLQDGFGRRIEYLRLSVTDRCDLRCSYCLPTRFRGFADPADWLTFDEVERVVGAFTRLGVSRVRLTGGEPLVRPWLPDLAARLARLPGLTDLSLSSNCTRMATLADDLYRAGIRRLNLSLDSLRADTFRQVTGGDLDKVLRGIAAAKRAGFSPIKVNTVVMRGVNDDELEAIIDFCAVHGFTLRLIETMPMGETGRLAHGQYLDLQEVRRRLAQRYELIPDVVPGGGPARYVRLGGTDIRIGFITPISQHFCETCNRVRLTVEGVLHLCLGQEHSVALRPLLRGGVSDDELEARLREAINTKPERHEFLERPTQTVRVMALTGG